MTRLSGENKKKSFYIFSSYCPLKFRALKTCIKYKEFCNQDISNTITARSFKLCQLIKDDEWITWWNLDFFVLPFANFAVENLY